jgi:hypothetical protein
LTSTSEFQFGISGTYDEFCDQVKFINNGILYSSQAYLGYPASSASKTVGMRLRADNSDSPGSVLVTSNLKTFNELTPDVYAWNLFNYGTAYYVDNLTKYWLCYFHSQTGADNSYRVYTKTTTTNDYSSKHFMSKLHQTGGSWIATLDNKYGLFKSSIDEFTPSPTPTASPSATPTPTLAPTTTPLPTATPSASLGLQDEVGFQFLGQLLSFSLGLMGYTVLASNLYKR